MAKMRTFTFIDGDKTETKEDISFKKAVKSYQSGTKSKSVIHLALQSSFSGD